MASAPTQTQSASLYVGDLKPEVTEGMLYEIFATIGPISSLKLCRDAQTRRSLGYAYVNFHTYEHADKALQTKNFTKILGKPCRIMWCQRDPQLRKSGKGNIFIKNLPKTFDDKKLWDMFGVYGKILSCIVCKKDQVSIGYGFVHFEDQKAASEAIKAQNGKKVDGCELSVSPFKSKDERLKEGQSTVTNLYMKHIPKGEDFTVDKLTKKFAEFGRVTSVMIAKKDDSKENRGFAFVNYETAEEAKKAIEATHDKAVFDEQKLYVQTAQPKAARSKMLRQQHEKDKMSRNSKFAGTNLFIKNLDDDIDDKQLNELFAPFGEIKSGVVMTDSKGKSKGFGFVNFANAESATDAVTKMNTKMVKGKPIYVALAQTKEERLSKLQQAFQNRQMKQAAAQMQMYPQGGAPQMYYQGQMPQQRVVYTHAQEPHMVQQQRRYYTLPGNMVRGMPAPMHMMANGGRGGRGRGRGGGHRGNRKGQNPNFKYTPNARNQPMQAGQQLMQMPVPVPVQGNAPQMQMQQPQLIPANAQPGMVPMQPQPAQQPAQNFATLLAKASPEKQRHMIGEVLYPKIGLKVPPEKAGKITGMLLELELSELLTLVESDKALDKSVLEAIEVLKNSKSEAE